MKMRFLLRLIASLILQLNFTTAEHLSDVAFDLINRTLSSSQESINCAIDGF